MVRDTPGPEGAGGEARGPGTPTTPSSRRASRWAPRRGGGERPERTELEAAAVVLIDEVDRFPPSAGTEGDPVDLAITRTVAFWNRLIFLNSSPSLAGLSRIAAAYEETDQCRYQVPCPACDTYQVLAWEHLRWEKREGRSGPMAKHRPETARYACPHCGYLISEAEKPTMVRAGRWVSTNPDATPGWRGFHINALYSLLARWEDLARKFLAATVPETNVEKLQVFVNTVLGEPFEAAAVALGADELHQRAKREEYSEDPLPEGVGVLTAGVDVQDDRIELVVFGWGLGEESWSLEHKIIRGDPSTHKIWDEDLHHALTQVYEHPAGVRLRIAAVGVDSGYHTQLAYRFCKAREANRVWAMKGVGTVGSPLMDRPTRRNKYKAALYKVGTDQAKTTIYSRLRLEIPGPGYCHHRPDYPEEYFEQLTAEKRRKKKNRRGYVTTEWVLRPGRRNEILDCTVLGLAAYEGLVLGGLKIDRVLEHIHSHRKKGVEKPKRRSRRRVISEGVS
jgi:phage terminase large subunit GpA-like protein